MYLLRKEVVMKKRGKAQRFFCMLLILAMFSINVINPVSVDAAIRHPYYIKINRQQNCVTVYGLDKNGEYKRPVKAFACSVGLNNATPLGTYYTPAKYRWHTLMGNVYGQYCTRITGGILFHSVFYRAQDPGQLAYNAYNQLGNAASHGCVRLNVADAKWIYDNCPVGTKVTIYDGKDAGPLGKPTPVKIDTSSPYRGWDPTDPNPNNPWRKQKPTITGVKNMVLERSNKKKELKKNVTATDYQGRNLSVKVSGKYIAGKTGKYKITYSATDSIGNTTKKSVYITVKDTKKPSISLKKKEISINEKLSKKELVSKIKKVVVVKDLGKKMTDKYIYVDVEQAMEGIKSEQYGTYYAVVYAKDQAGNKSKKLKIKIEFVNLNPDPVEPIAPVDPITPENPEEIEESEIPEESTEEEESNKSEELEDTTESAILLEAGM